MPPRKEVKEMVVYPSSKRKAPAFKPQRPSKVPRIPTTDSESVQPRKAIRTAAHGQRKTTVREEEDEESEDGQGDATAGAGESDSDEELDPNPLKAKPAKRKPSKSTRPALSKRRLPSRQASPVSISSGHISDGSPAQPSQAQDSTSMPSRRDDTPTIPQPLLVRLLHERFADKKTKIDKHAIQVLQRYFEVFVREAIARAQLQKKEDAENRGAASEIDVGWLELEDLEKVAAGMLLDF